MRLSIERFGFDFTTQFLNLHKRVAKFSGNFMPADESFNRFFIYELKVMSTLRQGAPSETYRQKFIHTSFPTRKNI